jgi:hypothetical protein
MAEAARWFCRSRRERSARSSAAFVDADCPGGVVTGETARNVSLNR